MGEDRQLVMTRVVTRVVTLMTSHPESLTRSVTRTTLSHRHHSLFALVPCAHLEYYLWTFTSFLHLYCFSFRNSRLSSYSVCIFHFILSLLLYNEEYIFQCLSFYQHFECFALLNTKLNNNNVTSTKLLFGHVC